MSFGSALKFEVGGSGTKPVILWDQAKPPKETRKFGYKKKELRHRLRQKPKDGSGEEFVAFRHDVQVSPRPDVKPEPKQEVLQPKPPRQVKMQKDFIRRNRDKISGKTKVEKSNDSHSMANTVTLTQDQLNAILASVGKLASGKENALRISIDSESNEIQIAPNEGEKTEKVEREKDGETENDKKEKDEEEGTIMSLVENKSEKGSRVKFLHENGAARRRRREDNASDSSRKEKDKKEKENRGQKNMSKTSGNTQSESQETKDSSKSEAGRERNKSGETKHETDVTVPYESPRVSWKHLTVGERKRLQWARERAELGDVYDPWGRPGAGAPIKSSGGDVLADYNTRKEDQAVENSKSVRRPVDGSSQLHQDQDKTSQNKDFSVKDESAVSGLVMGNQLTKKDEQKKKWLEELEKQREEQRLKRQKKDDRVGFDDTWADRFSTYKPAPLPQQDVPSTAINKKSSGFESSSSPNIGAQQHVAIRSSFVIGDIAPDDQRFNQTKEMEKRKWLEDLERQMEEDKKRKLRDKDEDTWAERSANRPHLIQSNCPRDPVSARVNSAPDPGSARDPNDQTYIRGQNVSVDPTTRKELEVKKAKEVAHQEALRIQIEEKERLKREERQRKMLEEMEAEQRVKKDLEGLQSQFKTEQQKAREKEEARQRRIDELKTVMDEAQEKALHEKLLRKMEHLRQGGHDVSHLKAHLDALSPRVQQTVPAQQAAPPHVPGLNLSGRTDMEPNTHYSAPEISSRTVDLPNPSIKANVPHQPYTENRVLTPSRYRHVSQPPRSDPSSPKREFGTQTLEEELTSSGLIAQRQGSDIDIEYKEPVKKVKPVGQTKKVRVKSAEKNVKEEPRRGRKKENVEKVPQGGKLKWNYQNPKLKKPVKQSLKDPFYEKKRQLSEERRVKRTQELLGLIDMNRDRIPDEPLSPCSRDPSPAKGAVSPRDRKGRSFSPEFLASVNQHRNDYSVSPHRSTERLQGRSLARQRTPSPPILAQRSRDPINRSPPVPALKHKREREKAHVPKVSDEEEGYENRYNNDQYNYSNYHPASGQRKSRGPYQDPNPLVVPNENGEFVPFTRTTEILDPARAVDPVQLSRENTRIQVGRKAYMENHDPASYGRLLENFHDRQEKNDPILNPHLVKKHPTARQDQILQHLSELRQGLLQKQREVTLGYVSPSDLAQ